MGFNWMSFASFIERLSRLAFQWYREVNGGNPDADSGERKARKAVSVVLDPDTPETDVSQVEVED